MEMVRVVPLECQGHTADGTYIGGNLIALYPIATSGSLYQLPMVIGEIYRSPVVFQLTNERDLVRA